MQIAGLFLLDCSVTIRTQPSGESDNYAINLGKKGSVELPHYCSFFKSCKISLKQIWNLLIMVNSCFWFKMYDIAARVHFQP